MARARQAGVVRILNPGIDLPSSRAAIDLADRFSEVYAAVGVHPNDALTWDDGTLDELRRLAQHPKVVAIGEIGLDYYWEKAPHDVQQRILRQQLELAGELGLPVVIHTRSARVDEMIGGGQATQDALAFLSDWQAELARAASPLAERPGVLHSYSGDVETARQATGLNFWIGITGPVTFKNAPVLQQVVASLPPERLLVETDAPFLTPHPHRGQRNEPAYVRFVAEKIAQIQNLPFDYVATATTMGAGRLFHWRVTS